MCVCATIRLNPQLSLTGLAEWTAEVYHCLLISSDSHQASFLRVAPGGNRSCGPGGGGDVLWPTYGAASKTATISLCREESNKSKLSGGNRCSRLSFLRDKYSWTPSRVINPINESLRRSG